MTDNSSSPASPTSPFRSRNFLLFLAARFTSTLMFLVMSVAVGWHIYDVTRDPLALGYVGLAQFLPMFLLTLPAGYVADRVNRRTILIATCLAEGICSAAFVGISVAGWTDPILFYAVLALFGVARAFSAPAGQSVIPLLVSRNALSRAAAAAASSFQMAVIVGPSIGGLLLSGGPIFAYGASTLFSLIAAGAFFRITVEIPPRAQSDEKETAWRGLTAGISYIRHHPIVLGAASLDLFAVLLGGAIAMMPVYARDILHAGPIGLGLLRSAPAVGAVVTGLTLARFPLRRYTGLIMFACVAGFGVATIIFGLSTNLVVSLIALFALGATDMVSMFVRGTLIQLAVPDAMRGRVSAVNFLFIGASNELGEFESGAVAALIGVVPSVILGGIGTLAVVALWMVLFPGLRKMDRLEDMAVEEEKPSPAESSVKAAASA